jgi:uncharacterized protein YjbJ (UPF0337 family)
VSKDKNTEKFWNSLQ